MNGTCACACALLLCALSVLLLASPIGALSRSRRRSRSDLLKRAEGERVKPGCCPPSYKAKYYRVALGEAEGNITYYWDSQLQASAEVYTSPSYRYIAAGKNGKLIDDQNNCVSQDVPDDNDSDIMSYVCLLSDSLYEGSHNVKLADGRTVFAQVYVTTVGSTRMVKYFLPNEKNCMPVGERWETTCCGTIEFALRSFELEKPPAAAFVIPESKCATPQA